MGGGTGEQKITVSSRKAFNPNQKSSLLNDYYISNAYSSLSKNSVISRRNMPMEEMHYILVQHAHLARNIE